MSGSSAWVKATINHVNELTADEKASSLRYQIMDVVEQIKWIPEFGYSREMDWLRNMHDWLISKKRYWGLALPIWECGECGNFEVIGSDDELAERATSGLDVLDDHTPHRPYIDAVTIACSKCGAEMSRVRGCGQPLAGCRYCFLQHPWLPQRPRLLAEVVPCRLDQ